MKKIKITIGADGSTKVEALGFQGASCEDATRSLEEALGDTTEKKLKPEHRQRARQREIARQS